MATTVETQVSRLVSKESSLFEKYDVIDSVLQSGNKGDVNRILEAGADVNDVDVNTEILVHCSTERNVELLKHVISSGADVNKPNRNDETALEHAVKNNDPECILEIIRAGADVNMITKLKKPSVSRDTKRRIIRSFVLSDNVELMDKLLAAGANVNDMDVKNEALYVSAMEGKQLLIKHLIKQGADVNMSLSKRIAFKYEEFHNPGFYVYDHDSRNSYVNTPLTMAVQHGHSACMETLAQAGAQYLPILKDLKIPPDQKGRIIEAVARTGNLELLNKALDLGAGVKGIEVANEALIGTAIEGNLELMKYLMSKGASVITKGVLRGWYDEQTALQAMMKYERYHCLDYVIRTCAEIMKATWQVVNRNAVVECLVKSGRVDYIKNLLNTAKPRKKKQTMEENKTTAEDEEIEEEKKEVVEDWSRETLVAAALTEAARQGKLDVIKYLVHSEGADVNTNHVGGNRREGAPWIVAISNEHPECAEFLLQSGFESEIQEALASFKTSDSDKCGIVQALLQLSNQRFTVVIRDEARVNKSVRDHALYWSAMTGNAELLTALLQQGAGVNDKIYGDPLLITAACSGKISSLEVLLQNGADVNKGNNRHENPLSLAVKGGHADCVNRLIKAGADVKTPEGYWLPMIEAIKLKSVECLQELINGGADVNLADCSEETMLMKAASEGNYKAVDTLISAGADVNKMRFGGTSALLNAAGKGCARSVNSLLKAGADVNSEYSIGARALQTAAAQSLECVDLLLRAGADVNAAVQKSEDFYSSCDDTALIVASDHGKESIVQLLLEKGADVNKTSSDGYTALFKAVDKGYADVVDTLIRAGADVNITGRYNKITPIYTAAMKGFPECLDLVLKAGADVNSSFEDCGTALYAAAEKGHDQCVELLIESGADVNTSIANGSTPLIKAALLEEERTLHLLIKGGADVNRADDKKNTALILAANKGNGESIRLLERAGADVNAKDDNGQTILMAAAVNGYPGSVRPLIAAGADVNLRDVKDNTALILAANGRYTGDYDLEYEDSDLAHYIAEIKEWIKTGDGHEECVQALIDAGADVNVTNTWHESPIILAAAKGLVHSVDLLIKAGANVNAIDTSGCTALVNASREGHVECVRSLIAAGAGVNHSTASGHTSVLLTTHNGHSKCLELLMDAGADVNVTNKNGQTALMIASDRGHTECIKLLLKAKGASVNALDEDGNTALFLAAHGVAQHKTLRKSLPSHEECIAVLVKAGADVNAVDDRGNTALMYAVHGHEENHDHLREFWSHIECVNLLLGAGADVNQKVEGGSTPLMAAACIIPRTVRACFKAGVHVNRT